METKSYGRALLMCAGLAAVCLLGYCSKWRLSFNGAMSRGDAEFRQANFEQASRYYQIAVRLNPMNGRAYVRLGLAQANAGNPVAAIANLRRGLQVLPGNDHNRSAIRVQLADLSLAHMLNPETLDESQATATEVLGKPQDAYDGLRIFGAVMLARAEWLRTRDRDLYDRVIHDSLRDFELANQVRPGQMKVVLTLARILSVMGRFSEAESRYRSLLDRDPRADAIRAELYRLLLLEHKRSEAREVQQAGASAASHPEWFLTMLAAQDLIDQNRPGMQAALEQLRRISKSQLRFCFLAGDFQLRSGDVENALREYHRCPARDTTSMNLCDERLIAALRSRGRSQMAKPVVKALLKRDPRNSIGLTFEGRLQIESGDMASALRTLDQVSSEDSGNYEAQLEDARAHFKLGEVGLARLKAGEALRLRPDFLPALLLTAQIQFKWEEYLGAADTITRMLTIDPENREARLMNAVLRDGIGSDVGSRLSNPFLTEVVAKIASGRFQDAANLFKGSHADGAQAYREMPADVEATQDGAEGRFVYLRRTDCDDAVARNRELAMSPNDPFVLAKAVPGPWPPPEQTFPNFSFTP